MPFQISAIKGSPFFKPLFQLFGRQDSVVDLAPECALGLTHLNCELSLVRLAHKQQIDIAGGIGFILSERPIEPCGPDSMDGAQGALQRGHDADGALQQREERLQQRRTGIDAVVKLAAFRLRPQQAFLLQPRQLSRQIGGVGLQRLRQLAHIHARLAIHVKEREQPAA